MNLRHEGFWLCRCNYVTPNKHDLCSKCHAPRSEGEVPYPRFGGEPKPAVEVQDTEAFVDTYMERADGNPFPELPFPLDRMIEQRDKQWLATVDECLKDRDYFSDKLEKQEAACKQQQARIEELEGALRDVSHHAGSTGVGHIARAALAETGNGEEE